MIGVLLLTFVSAFVIFALIMIAGGSGASRDEKKTLAVLQAALATEKATGGDQVGDIRKAELFSQVSFINRLLLQVEIAPRLRIYLYQANLKWTVGTLLLMCACSGAIAYLLLYMRMRQVLVAIVAGIIASLLPILFVRQKRARRFHKFEEGLPEATDMIVNALRAGHSLVSALGLVATEAPDPVGGEFRICFEEQNFGLELRTAMANLIARVPIQDLRIIIAAILIQKESGGNLAEVLEKSSEVIRERFRLKRQVSVFTAQGRMTGWILTFLPVILGIALWFIAPDNISLLWRRDIGIKLLYGSGIMIVLGALIIQKIVNIDV